MGELCEWRTLEGNIVLDCEVPEEKITVIFATVNLIITYAILQTDFKLATAGQNYCTGMASREPFCQSLTSNDLLCHPIRDFVSLSDIIKSLPE